MKIAIVTVYDSIVNYGSFLQAYALCRVLERKGHQVYFIRRMNDDLILDRFNQIVLDQNRIIKKNSVKSLAFRIKQSMIVNREQRANLKRFECFKRDWESIQIIDKDDLEHIGINLIICGSDEIWNMHNRDIDLDFYGCGWIHGIPKLAYAISSGDTKTAEFLTVPSWMPQIGDFNQILPRDIMTQQMSYDVTGKRESIVCDPTILLGKNGYALSDAGKKWERYILIYSYYLTKAEKKDIKRYAEENHLKIISPCIYSSIADEVVYTSSLEFPSLVANAECVFTTTFHGTIFSLMFAKRMCCSPRLPKVANLLEQVDGKMYALSKNGSYEEFKTILNRNIDRNNVDNALNNMRTSAESELDRALAAVEENGYRPLGVRYCDKKQYFYGFSLDDANVRNKSSSGGLFYEMGTEILDRGGVVFGARFDESTKTVKHCSTEEVSIQEMLKSKYLESELGDTFKKIEKYLKEGRDVLFCGTPCQAAGLYQLREKKWLGNKEHLFIVDFLCEGVPSKRIFQQYLKAEEKKAGKQIKNVDFRSKSYGWNIHCMKINYMDGSHRIRPSFADSYMHTFIMDLAMNRASCYKCKFRIDKKSDITIGDFWKINKVDSTCTDNKGVSAIFVNSELGKQLLDSIAGKNHIVKLPEENIADMQQLLETSHRVEKRNRFYDEFIKNGYKSAIYKESSYMNNLSLIKRLKLGKQWLGLELKRRKTFKR